MIPLVVIVEVKLILKIIQVILISSVKFIFAPPISFEMGLGYLETIAFTTAGGILGIFFFYHLSGWLIRMYRNHIKPTLKSFFFKKHHSNLNQAVPKNTNSDKKPVFNWKTRFILKVKRKWGLIGICILTPTIFSIPIGSFLANKYYSNNKHTLVYLSISVFAWSLLVSTVYYFTF